MNQNRLHVRLVFLLAVLLLVGVAHADAPPEPRDVQIEAADGLMLAGTLYAPPTDVIPGEGWPTVLLMHQNGSSRQSWQPLIEPLTQTGYNALAVDLRAHGETGGARDWQAAVGDVQAWLDWLREQEHVRGDAISIVGASIGSNLALIGCANDAQCVTAVALSPGEDYFGIMPGEALTGGLADRSALLVASQTDRESADSVRQFVQDAPGEIGVRLFPGGAHGTGIFSGVYEDSLIALIVAWLDEHTPE